MIETGAEVVELALGDVDEERFWLHGLSSGATLSDCASAQADRASAQVVRRERLLIGDRTSRALSDRRSPYDEKMTTDPKFLLSLDGGGLRGIIPAMVLAKLKAQTGRPAGETTRFSVPPWPTPMPPFGGPLCGGPSRLPLRTPR